MEIATGPTRKKKGERKETKIGSGRELDHWLNITFVPR